MKKTITLSLAVVLICSLVGCGTISAGNASNETKVPVSANVETQEAAANGIRPEFKKAMDEYEAFYGEYCAFMKKYQENPTDLALISEYTELASKAVDMSAAFEEWDQDEMSSEELKYYLEVSGRVTKKLAEIAG